jgi:hypothetical protein
MTKGKIMGLYVQTTEADKYLKAVAGLAPATLAQNVQLYKMNRAVFLGLQMGQMGPQGQFQPLPQATALKLSDKLKALGNQVVPLLQASGRHKEFIEAEVKTAVTALGGFNAIIKTSEWGFVLDDVVKDNTGKITDYVLPGLPFTITQTAGPNQPPTQMSVNIIPAQDGTGTPEFSAINASTPTNGDPL